MRPFAVLLLVVTASSLGAQTPTYVWTPTGSAANTGGSANTIPFWGMSATYQQILDASDFSAPLVQMKGMAMRPAGSYTLTGRSWDLRITLSHTKVNAANASSTFSTNLQGANTTVVFGSSTTFTRFSWSTATGTGTVNPPAFTVPFVSPFAYIRSLGNLCWEWRQRNASTNTVMYVDATYAPSQVGTALGSTGQGCTVKTSANPATATISTTGTVSVGYSFQSVLSNAAANANAFMAVGVTPKTQNLGWCAPVYLVPVILVGGKTDASGSWTFQAPLALLAGTTPFNIYMQYVYDDASQAAGLGLSNLAGYRSPTVPGAHVITRIYKSQFGGTSNGDELATTGTVGKYFGLLIGWLQ